MSRHRLIRSRVPSTYPWRVIGVAVLLLITVSIARADQPLTGTLTRKLLGQQVTFATPHSPAASHWAGTIGLQLDRDAPGDGRGELVPVFCIQANVSTALGNRYVADGQVVRLLNGCQMRYLLAQYPAGTAGSAAEAAARQLAIWHFSDAIDLSSIRQNAIRTRAMLLAAEADLDIALHGCPGMRPLVSEFTLEPRATSLPAGQSAIYTVRISPPAAATVVVIRITGAAALADGRHAATLALSQGVVSFAVRGAGAGTAIIAAQLPDQLDAGTVFSSVGQQRPAQRLVLGAPAALARQAALTIVESPAGTPSATPTPAAAPTLTARHTPTPAASPAITQTPVAPATSTPAAETPLPTHTPAAATPAPHRHITPQAGPTGTPPAPSAASGPPPGTAPTPASAPLAEAPRPASLPRTGEGAGAAGFAPLALLLIAGGAALHARRRLLGAH